MERHNVIGPCSPLFIVSSVKNSLRYYVEFLGFECRYKTPDSDPFFAIVGRDLAQIMIKTVSNEVIPQPNKLQHDWARWDAFVFVQDPDHLANELTSRNTNNQITARDTDDGLRGFELSDPDGYICFYGHPNYSNNPSTQAYTNEH